MLYPLNLEQMENYWIAHVPALLGCFAFAPEREAAVAAAPQAIAEHRAWLRAHGEDVADEPVETQVDEVAREWWPDPDNSVNAFFASDRTPLTGPEVADALLWLDWNRADLLDSIVGLGPADLAREVETGWSINRILLHTGRAEWWYLDRLDLAFPKEDRPEEPLACLDKVRSYFKTIVPTLVNDDRVTEIDFEIWSPRKMLRRALWHERDHMLHIKQFRQKLG
jgi:predicted RNase H-like HicB family nuclease